MATVLLPSKHRTGVITLVFGLAVIVGAAAAGVYFGGHLRTAFAGPTTITREEIAKLDDPAQLPSTWVEVEIANATKSKVVIEKRPANGGISHVAEEFVIFPAGERWMIAAVPRGFTGNTLSGQIAKRDDNAGRSAVAKVTAELESTHKGKLFPFQFDASEDYGTQWKIGGGLLLFAAAAGLLFACLGVSVIRKCYLPPDPADYGLDPADYADLDVKTPEDAKAAIARFIHDAGITPEPDWQENV